MWGGPKNPLVPFGIVPLQSDFEKTTYREFYMRIYRTRLRGIFGSFEGGKMMEKGN